MNKKRLTEITSSIRSMRSLDDKDRFDIGDENKILVAKYSKEIGAGNLIAEIVFGKDVSGKTTTEIALMAMVEKEKMRKRLDMVGSMMCDIATAVSVFEKGEPIESLYEKYGFSMIPRDDDLWEDKVLGIVTGVVYVCAREGLDKKRIEMFTRAVVSKANSVAESMFKLITIVSDSYENSEAMRKDLRGTAGEFRKLACDFLDDVLEEVSRKEDENLSNLVENLERYHNLIKDMFPDYIVGFVAVVNVVALIQYSGYDITDRFEEFTNICSVGSIELSFSDNEFAIGLTKGEVVYVGGKEEKESEKDVSDEIGLSENAIDFLKRISKSVKGEES